ncbi:hypothetical protein F2Q68_00039651 [Brassica cretica]|uniref:Uncharacterized protein n=2 Tax=Brassica cretica TaxID=69181 RepID=A0A8S9MK62_BRACR|nr:hypothetical protein F2Q68_00039651 [Brassica cretica]KAF3498154.1 hypothetical protein DY000_02053369 [Brassica cretica]
MPSLRREAHHQLCHLGSASDQQVHKITHASRRQLPSFLPFPLFFGIVAASNSNV